tara:strand:- start:520 stop:1269 length:750 start_codon:yes stop_codon:yes gene_type:complete
MLSRAQKKKLEKLKIKIFADGSSKKNILYYNDKYNFIEGFTTNPSLMKENNVDDYKKFAKEILNKVKKPISFEVIEDNYKQIYNEAKIINSWGKNVFVKIPIINSKGKYNLPLINRLNMEGVKLNITAIFTKEQINFFFKNINKKINKEIILSIFSGRIADTGSDPISICSHAIKLKRKKSKKIKILWASTREVYNLFEAEKIRCDIITMPVSLINKFKYLGYSLKKYSIKTVKDFCDDAKKAGLKIKA